MKWRAYVSLHDTKHHHPPEWRGTKGGTLMPGSLWELEVVTGVAWTVLRGWTATHRTPSIEAPGATY